MKNQDKLADTRNDVAEDAPKKGFGVLRNPDGSRITSPESVNTTKDSEATSGDKSGNK